MTPVTLWYVRIGDDWIYNHLTIGHVEATKPPEAQFQSNKSKWHASYAWLTDDKPARVVYYNPDDLVDEQRDAQIGHERQPGWAVRLWFAWKNWNA